ncbi:MAG: response regulator transcription factor [Chloroflexi bacterium]|nr:MAG: response regulator transcription factor [Chloroflexota bacterium]TME47477.1 MAG: response regulator transcription factor [Chloroflexota bacterium]
MTSIGVPQRRVLIVEDDVPLRSALLEAVKQGGFQALAAPDGAAAVKILEDVSIDVVLLDIGLPFVNGWQVLSQLDAQQVPAVIIISARGDERDKIRALDMGADDYLAKPFGAEELLARVRAVLRRSEPDAGPSLVVRAEDVTIDLAHHAVFRGGREIRLSPTEYVLLAELAKNAGTVMEHRKLLRRVWGPAYLDERNYLRTFVQRLRAKLEANPEVPRAIVTVGGRGYRFGEPPVPD